jgi:hypothetical protein
MRTLLAMKQFLISLMHWDAQRYTQQRHATAETPSASFLTPEQQLTSLARMAQPL